MKSQSSIYNEHIEDLADGILLENLKTDIILSEIISLS
jgi:hypothetical protein